MKDSSLDPILKRLHSDGYSLGHYNRTRPPDKKILFTDEQDIKQAKKQLQTLITKREREARIDELKTYVTNLPDVDSTEVWLKTRLSILEELNTSEGGE